MSGAIIEAAVMMATVDEPCAVLSAAAIRKGIQIPRCEPEKLSPTTSAIPESLSTMPNEPPAAVIMIMTAADTSALPTQPVVESISRSNFLGSNSARATPISRAITGSPINPITALKFPVPKGFVGKSETDLSTINSNGTTIGRKDLTADGAFLTFSSISWSL